LLDSPTRGSLAGDSAFLERIRQRTAVEAARDPGRFGSGTPTDPAGIKVLFAGDLPDGQRMAVAAGLNGRPFEAEFTGATGASASDLALSGTGQLDPVVYLQLSDVDLLLAPAGSQLQVSSQARYLADGSVDRTWSTQPGDYLLKSHKELPVNGRVRVIFAGTTVYDVPLHRVLDSTTESVNPNPLYGRGKAVPVAARQVTEILAETTGLTSPPCHYEVLWSDEIPMPGLPDSSTAIIATVLALTPDGGGLYATYSFDPANPTASAGEHPSGNGVLGDPDRSLIAMRLPAYSGTQPTDALQVIAPARAVRAEASRGGTVVATTDLVHGGGQLKVAVPAVVTVRAYDATGKVVAQRVFDDSADQTLYEPDIRPW
jgi:hypothetical protein